MSCALKWVGLGLGGLVALVVAVWDWNWFKAEVTEWATAAVGRDIAIEGDIDIDLAWAPRVRLERVRVENADWGSAPTMVSIRALRALVSSGAQDKERPSGGNDRRTSEGGYR